MAVFKLTYDIPKFCTLAIGISNVISNFLAASPATWSRKVECLRDFNTVVGIFDVDIGSCPNIKLIVDSVDCSFDILYNLIIV